MIKMTTQVDETYRNLSEKRIQKIITFLNNLNYPESVIEEKILPYIAQWLYNNYVAIESTCLIISEIINIEHIQSQIDDIYDAITPPLPCKSHLQKLLSHNEYFELETLLEPREKSGTVSGEIDDTTNIVTNFKTKQVLQEKITYKRDGTTDSKFTPIIEAVPYKLIVYDSPLLDQPRTFKIIWDSTFTSRKFTTAGENAGATIKEIENYLVDAGFSHNPRYVAGAVSCMINSLIDSKFAEIKTDIDNPGFYYNPDTDKITVVKKVATVPENSQIYECINILNELSKYYDEHLDTLSTVLKWCLMSEFSYAMKQAGNYMKWLYLKGTSQSGKTTIGRIGLFLHGMPLADKNDIGGSSVDTVARLGAVVSKSCDMVLVNEPASVFNRKATKEMIKLCVQSTLARSKYVGSKYSGIPAFAPILFTANMYLPEDDAIINRLHVISFSYSQRKSDFEKKEFENKFRINSPHISPVRSLSYLGQFAASEIITNPGLLLDDWKDTADKIIKDFYNHVDIKVPDWLTTWVESESIGDLDDTQREDIRNFFVIQFNIARKKVVTYNEYGNRSDQTLDVDEASTSEDFTDVNWSIVNNRMLPWAIPFTSKRGTKYICLTQGLRKALGDELDFCADLRSIGELLGWNVKPVRLGKNNSDVKKLIKVNFDEFMEFMYPNVDLEDVE